MEALLKLSGLLSDEDVDRTDLSMLEKRLVDKTTARSNSSTPSDTPQSQRGSQPPPSANSGSLLSPASANKLPTPQSMSNSPQPAEETNREEEVEALSDMMCSLVTNNCGETRYIGTRWFGFRDCLVADCPRVIVRILYLFPQRHTMDQRKDGRYIFPRDDHNGRSRRHQVGVLETRDLW